MHLFEGFGVELEYMIVDRDQLGVLPVTDEVLKSVAGNYTDEVKRGAACWSNEVVLHVIELKTNGPVDTLAGLEEMFCEQVRAINEILEEFGGFLLPTGMHPLMDPDRETRLWPHEHSAVYDSYDRIFGCQGHGWSNLQSVHLNLPFEDDDQFGKLHAAIRVLLPMLPALAASSPVMDGQVTGVLDNRLKVYKTNQERIPSITGAVIPEAVFTAGDYRRIILERIFDDVAPFDAEGILQHEWLNSRGAIARFQRNTIEVRVLDVQETPPADLAICWLVVTVLKMLTDETIVPQDAQRAASDQTLTTVYDACVQDAERAEIESGEYLSLFGLMPPIAAGDLWRHFFAEYWPEKAPDVCREAMTVILEKGTLARRIVNALGSSPTAAQIHRVYRTLARRLVEGKSFTDVDAD